MIPDAASGIGCCHFRLLHKFVTTNIKVYL